MILTWVRRLTCLFRRDCPVFDPDHDEFIQWTRQKQHESEQRMESYNQMERVFLRDRLDRRKPGQGEPTWDNGR